MQTFLIFLILFFIIIMVVYPLLRIIYFITSKKTVQNKVLNIIIIILSLLITYLILRNKIDFIMNLNLGQYINSKKELALIVIAIVIGNISETLINSLINFFVKRRMRTR